MTLKDAVQFAFEHAPAFDSARKTLGVSELSYTNAWTKLLPSLDFTTTDGWNDTIPQLYNTSNAVTAPLTSTMSLGLTETLYDNGVSLTALGVARLTREAAEINALKARDSMALDIATEYYRYSLNCILLDVKIEQQEILEREFRSLNSQYRQGFQTKSDYLRIKTQVQRAEIDRVTAEGNIALSLANLRKFLGVDVLTPEPPNFVPWKPSREHRAVLPTTPPPIEDFFDYKTTKIQNEINASNVTLAKRLYWPQLALNSGITYANQNYLNSGQPFPQNNTLTWNALATLTFNLWDWGIRNRNIGIADLNRDVQDDALRLNLLTVQSQIAALMAEITRVEKTYDLSEELLRLEEESNKDLKARYREGKVAYLDLITEINNLLNARVQFYTSYFDALTNQARYHYYQGKLYDTVTAQ